MSSDVVSVDADAEMNEVIETRRDQRIGAVPVVDGEGNVIGVISYIDIMRSFVGELEPSDTWRSKAMPRAAERSR